MWYKVGPLGEGSSGASVRGAESQERARESLKCPHGLSHWRFIFICSLFLGYFQLKSTILREVSACPETPKQYCSALHYFFWRPCCRYIIINFFSQPIIKWKKNNFTLSEKFQKFNRKIVEIGKFDIPNTHIHDRSLSGLSTGTSVKSDGVKLVGL